MANLSDSDRNTDWFDAPSDGPDGYREEDTENVLPGLCIYCKADDAMVGSDYCSTQCAIDAENDR